MTLLACRQKIHHAAPLCLSHAQRGIAEVTASLDVRTYKNVKICVQIWSRTAGKRRFLRRIQVAPPLISEQSNCSALRVSNRSLSPPSPLRACCLPNSRKGCCSAEVPIDTSGRIYRFPIPSVRRLERMGCGRARETGNNFR